MCELTAERVRELFDYDEKNGWLIRKTFRNGCPYNRPCGHKPNGPSGRGRVKIDGKKYLTHRIIWLLVHGTWPEGDIDHIDRNPMNNRIDNLREVRRAENMHNLELRKDNSSGYPGVSWHKRDNKYQSYIGVDGKLIYLGLFNTAEEAFLAYQLAKIEYHPSSPIAQEYMRELTLAG